MQVSHLPFEEVFQALLSLTSNEHPILTASPSLDVLESKNISESLLGVNEEFLQNVAKSNKSVSEQHMQ